MSIYEESGGDFLQGFVPGVGEYHSKDAHIYCVSISMEACCEGYLKMLACIYRA